MRTFLITLLCFLACGPSDIYGEVVFDEDFADGQLNGWIISYGNTDSQNCTYEVSDSSLKLTYVKASGSDLWTSFGISRAVDNVGDFNFAVDAMWHQEDIVSAPFIKILLYSGSKLVLSLNYEDRSKAGFGVSRCYSTEGGWNLINSAPSASGVTRWEVDRINGDVAVRLDGKVFSTFHDEGAITMVRVYLQGYAMNSTTMPWEWQSPLAIGLGRIAMSSEPKNPMPAAKSLWLPSIFSDNMILQQGKEVSIWGKAQGSQTVTVSLDGQQWQTNSDQNGDWAISLPPRSGGFQEQTLSVSCGDESVVYENVLFGELWLCSGQSNMEWWVGYTKEAQEALSAAEDRNLRFFTVYKDVSDTALEDPRGLWLTARKDTVGDFSAVAYQLGLYLRDQLQVPVGMIVAAWGGTRVECWMERSLLDQQFPDLIARWQQDVADYDPATMDASLDPMLAYYRPAGLYNGMISPIKPYSIRGFAWYQGESNVQRAQEYRTLFPALIELWRQDWNEELPFIFVQLPNYGTRSDVPRDSEWAQLRDAQNQALALADVGMAVTIDIGDAELLHPDNKKEVGRRLGLEALRIAYGRSDVPQSPRVDGFTGAKCTDRVRLKFSYTSDEGLVNAAGGKDVSGFIVSDSEGVLYAANAEIIDNDVVLVWSDEVDEPKEVRYGWDYNPLADLFDKARGLPVGTFSAEILAMDKELIADVTGDCYVEMDDLAAVHRQWLESNDPENGEGQSVPALMEDEIILNDDFSDGERLTQALVDSAKWFKRLPADVEVDTLSGDYRLVMAETTIQQVWAHFTEPQSPITLEVGQSLSVVMRLSLPKAADVSWNRALMFGLFNSNGTRDGVDNSGTGALREDDRGYYAETNPGRTTLGYAKIQKMIVSDTAMFNDHFINYATLGMFSSFLMAQDTGYDVEFSAERVSDTMLVIGAKVGPNCFISGVEDVPDEAEYFSFDTVSILFDGRAFPGDTGSLTVDKVKVTYCHAAAAERCDDVIAMGNILRADINRDCYVGIDDIILLAQDWIDCYDGTDVFCL